ncbi:hypothetical protein [Cellulosimicrobium sp. TH-20]|uniref:hypothetical protein n=1 Tax=Cellulosimicrobium sp. TH-20 TaxID=1980001 RepID=UPI0011A5F502|nr:hypothetical protein [Cellulosimicrobium sp. TH-20]
MTNTTFQAPDLRDGIRLAVSMGGVIAVAVVDLLMEAGGEAIRQAAETPRILTEGEVYELGTGAAMLDAEGDLWVAGPHGWHMLSSAVGLHGEPLSTPVPLTTPELIADAHDNLFFPFALVREG